jgi:undecaprenyl-phosphate 4-deoxy-4-formamido-L-arabinose transferase
MVPGISVIVPHFNSEELRELVDQVETSLKNRFEFEIIIVDDSNSTHSWSNLKQIYDFHEKVKCIELSKNYGQHNAILAGIEMARYELIVTIDDDLQVFPTEILVIYNHLVNNNLDLVYGAPRVSKHGSTRKVSSKILKFILRKVLRIKTAEGINSFRIFKKSLLVNFVNNSTGDVSIDALLFWSTSNFDSIYIEHNIRKLGSSSYTFRKLFNLAIETLIGYSTLPLRISTAIGLILSLIGLILLSVTLIQYFMHGIQIEGFATIITLLTIFSGAQFLTLGVIGEYIRKIHTNSMRKPTFVVRSKLSRD